MSIPPAPHPIRTSTVLLAPFALLLIALPRPSSAGTALETFTLPLPSPGNGIYFPDLRTSFPEVDWQNLDRLYIPAGHFKFIRLGNLPLRSPASPLVITNSGGQVRVGGLDHYYNFVVSGGSNWRLTGRHDAAAQTGHPDCPGHDGGYATSLGRYGILIDDAFEDEGNSGGAPVEYAAGDYVTHEGLLYRALTTHTNQPPATSPAAWQAQALPNDDVRLTASSAFQGHGLLDNIANQALFADGFEVGSTSEWTTP